MLAPMRRPAPLLVSLGLLVGGWLLGRALFEIEPRFSDVPLYREYGERMAGGELPYRDVPIEYPPAALPFFALPAAVSSGLDGFRLAFELLLLGCAASILALVDAVLRRMGASWRRRTAALSFVALAPLALGRVAWERYDLWPAALAAAGVAALLAGRLRLSAAALGLGAAAKLFPLALLPLLAIVAWRQRGRREALLVTAVALAVLVACWAPFLVSSPRGAIEPVVRQVERPLQIESVGATLLLTAREAAGVSVGVESSYGSTNLGGRRADLVAAGMVALAAACLALIWLAAARGAPAAGVACASLAAVVVFGKVLSPQFLLWLVPLAVLLGGRLGLAVCALLGGALLVTNVVFPERYLELIRLDSGAIWLVAARNALLVGLLVLLLRWLRYARQPPVSPL